METTYSLTSKSNPFDEYPVGNNRCKFPTKEDLINYVRINYKNYWSYDYRKLGEAIRNDKLFDFVVDSIFDLEVVVTTHSVTRKRIEGNILSFFQNMINTGLIEADTEDLPLTPEHLKFIIDFDFWSFFTPCSDEETTNVKMRDIFDQDELCDVCLEVFEVLEKYLDFYGIHELAGR